MKLKYLATLAMTEVVIVAVFILPLMLGMSGVMAVALALGLFCVDEILRLRQATHFHRIGGAVIACAAFWLLAWLQWPWKLALIAISMLLLAVPTTARTLTLLTLYPVVFASFMPELFRLAGGATLLVFTYAVTESCDSFALLIGKLFGRHKPFRLSPNKTIEGVAGGIVVATIIGAVAGHWLDWNWSMSLGVSTLLACTTVLGDLAASKIKRFCKVKDFGNVLPLQGGVLDIYDSALFNLPIAFVCFFFQGT